MLCADLVDVEWRDEGGRVRRTVANLEDISLSGACLQLDLAIPQHAGVKITYPNGELAGRVRYCVFREIGYFIGVEFDPGRTELFDEQQSHILRYVATRENEPPDAES